MKKNKAVLISYPFESHVPPDHALPQGVVRGRKMATGLCKIFLSEPEGRLRPKMSGHRFARARLTMEAALDPNHASTPKPPAKLLTNM